MQVSRVALAPVVKGRGERNYAQLDKLNGTWQEGGDGALGGGGGGARAAHGVDGRLGREHSHPKPPPPPPCHGARERERHVKEKTKEGPQCCILATSNSTFIKIPKGTRNS